jgi:hypothetical protein
MGVAAAQDVVLLAALDFVQSLPAKWTWSEADLIRP